MFGLIDLYVYWVLFCGVFDMNVWVLCVNFVYGVIVGCDL